MDYAVGVQAAECRCYLKACPHGCNSETTLPSAGHAWQAIGRQCGCTRPVIHQPCAHMHGLCTQKQLSATRQQRLCPMQMRSMLGWGCIQRPAAQQLGTCAGIDSRCLLYCNADAASVHGGMA